MSKISTRLLSLALSIVLGSSFQALSMDSWYKDGQNEQGQIKFKNDTTGQIRWSSEHLDPQKSRPSAESTLWLAHKYTLTNSPTFKHFSFHIVTPGRTHGALVAKYQEGSPIEIFYFHEGQAIEESKYSQALDLVLNELSNYRINFPSFQIEVDRDYPTLAGVLEEIKADEARSQTPSTSTISQTFNRLTAEQKTSLGDHMLASFFLTLPSMSWVIKRRPTSPQH